MNRKKRKNKRRIHHKNRKLKKFAKNLFMWIGICVVVYFLITSFTNIRISGIPSFEVDSLERNYTNIFSERINILEKQYGFDFKLIEKRRIGNQAELNEFYNTYTGIKENTNNFPLYAFSFSMRVPSENMRFPSIVICNSGGLTSQSKNILR